MSGGKGFFRRRAKGIQPEAEGHGQDLLQLRIAQIRGRSAVHETWLPEKSAETEQMKSTCEEAPAPRDVGDKTGSP